MELERIRQLTIEEAYEAQEDFEREEAKKLALELEEQARDEQCRDRPWLSRRPRELSLRKILEHGEEIERLKAAVLAEELALEEQERRIVVEEAIEAAARGVKSHVQRLMDTALLEEVARRERVVKLRVDIVHLLRHPSYSPAPWDNVVSQIKAGEAVALARRLDTAMLEEVARYERVHRYGDIVSHIRHPGYIPAAYDQVVAEIESLMERQESARVADELIAEELLRLEVLAEAEEAEVEYERRINREFAVKSEAKERYERIERDLYTNYPNLKRAEWYSILDDIERIGEEIVRQENRAYAVRVMEEERIYRMAKAGFWF